MKKLASYFGIAALTFAAAQAGAASLTLAPVGGIDSSVGTNGNDYPDAPETLDLGQLVLEGDGPVEVSFYYLGNEAGYTNEFFAYNSDDELALTFSTSGLPDKVWGETLIGTILMNTGALDFGFCTSGGDSIGIDGRCVQNLFEDSIIAQWDGDGYRSIAYEFLDDGSVLAYWDDSGAKNDDNHDDMIVRIAVARVPAPETLSLLGIGLLALGMVRFRQNKTA